LLVMSVAHRATSTVTAPDDNVLTYQASPSGGFLINSYDLPALGFQDTKFVWAFIGFDDPISPLVIAGDFNRDGVVNTADYEVWRAQFGQMGQSLSADSDGDGVVNSADYVIWRKSQTATLSARGSAVVPEPATIAMAVLAATPFCSLRLTVPWLVRRIQR
jgi:hypothetical protein